MDRCLPVALLLMLLVGCGSGPVIDTRYSAASQDSRVQYVILHYTSSGLDRSLGHLAEGGVSSHYLIDRQPPTIYRLVDESRRAWHAGESSWQGRSWLNASSIGIELVHYGYHETAHGRLWPDYDPAQIEALVVLLRDILQRHNLGPERVIGHSDVAPQRKVDPGPTFPWQQLAAAGVAIWPDTAVVQQWSAHLKACLPPIGWYQRALAEVGYPQPVTGELDPATRNVLTAFQMRFRPQRHDGMPDAETAALLAALSPQAARQLVAQQVVLTC
ncbi:N-acetylmuramoyl-L-alanine amidase [Halopseudomonas salegens]|uniref:N-acetylmuramoyl-L-alanine amidase n=1 Tax=Halopseudomonas salegens TaxID=1434072 RepID=A0A1H2HX46_9GAMM|nr:N-acetylmuramoyl-L-alanine amidase [Halopseudomonas salegens]SDU36329.1 N-acetylmuramoyl-L-alanine amidase [Halopseudomonas salegens]